MRAEIETYCRDIGADLDYVQGAGGNVSWKDGELMWVKASGTWLSDACQKDIFVPVDLHAVNTHLSQDDFEFKPPVEKSYKNSLRPSIETILHAIMPHSVVSHTHLVEAVFFLVQDNPKSKLFNILDGKLNWGLVDYARPGPELGKLAHELLLKKSLDVVFLANHGVIVGGDSVEQVQQRYDLLRSLLQSEMPEKGEGVIGSLPNDEFIQDFHTSDCVYIQGLALDQQIVSQIKKRWALYPDHVVFLGAVAPLFDSVDDLKRYLIQDTHATLQYAIVPTVGVFVKKGINDNNIAMLRFFYHVLYLIKELDSVTVLTDEDIAGLVDWDAEKYRQKIAK